MNPTIILPQLASVPSAIARGLRGMFNLNDGKWGRDGDKPSGDAATGQPPSPAPDTRPPASAPNSADSPAPAAQPAQPSNVHPIGSGGANGGASGGGKSGGPNQGPPDLDELWRDFNKKLGGLFGGPKNPGNKREPDWNRYNKNNGNNQNQGGDNKGSNNNGANNGGGNNGNSGGFQPDMKSAGIGVGLIAAIAGLIWLGTGFFIVQEGQQGVITQFGKFHSTVEAGFNWRMPYPVQKHETVNLTQLRSVEIGRNSVVQATGLKESSMLTQDENIVDIRFTIQYRLKSAAEYLFENRSPDDAVVKAAESAIREVVGRGTMDTVLNKDRESIQSAVVKSVQAQLDRYKAGIQIQTVNIQNVQPPERVQAAFDDALKAGQDRDRLKNEGQAYANDVIPRAKGTASRLKEEADGYKARVIAQAEGDAQRFKSVLVEYQKAPQVTRDRMYLDTMQQVYTNVTKIMVDSKQGNNLLNLPLDRIMQMNAQSDIVVIPNAGSTSTPATPVAPAGAPVPSTDPRSRDAARTRDRDAR
jgi:modulator of FtsH protease HflK